MSDAEVAAIVVRSWREGVYTMAETERPAYYTMYIKRANDPLSGTPLDMWAVMEEAGEGASFPGARQVAYCTSSESAERIKALLVYYGDKFPEHDDIPPRLTP